MTIALAFPIANPMLLVILLTTMFRGMPISEAQVYVPHGQFQPCDTFGVSIYAKEGDTFKAICLSAQVTGSVIVMNARDTATNHITQITANGLTAAADALAQHYNGLYAASAHGWASPGITSDWGRPQNDCGRNWTYWIETGKEKRLCLGIVSENFVDTLARKIRDEEMGGQLKPGEIWINGPTDYALDYIQKILWGFR